MSALRDKELGEQVGRRLRFLRLFANLTQVQVGEACGINRAIISRIERGLHVPSLPTVLRVAAAVGCKPSEVLCVLDEAV